MYGIVVFIVIQLGWLLMISGVAILGLPYMRKDASWREHRRPPQVDGADEGDERSVRSSKKYSLILFSGGATVVGLGEFLRRLWLK